jgi:hypothetical protein
MKIDRTEFGSITIDGKTYDHDVVIRKSGKVRKRKKNLSRKHGSSHTISLEEAEFIYRKGSRELVIGTGQNGNVRLSPEAREFFEQKRCEVIAEPTPQAIHIFNALKSGKKIGLFHVTC